VSTLWHTLLQGFRQNTLLQQWLINPKISHKLSIQLFSEDILRTLEIILGTSVHHNPALSWVQKLNYLRAQLQGEAICVISGLPFTNDSYNDPVALLEDKYGQPHRLITDMKALRFNNSLDSLQLFYDAIKIHTCSFASFGKPTSVYGAMLITNIMSNTLWFHQYVYYKLLLPHYHQAMLSEDKYPVWWRIATIIPHMWPCRYTVSMPN